MPLLVTAKKDSFRYACAEMRCSLLVLGVVNVRGQEERWHRHEGTLLARRRSQEGGQRVVALSNVLQWTRVTKVRERDQKVLTQELEQTRVGKDTTTLGRGTFVSVRTSRARVSDNGVR